MILPESGLRAAAHHRRAGYRRRALPGPRGDARHHRAPQAFPSPRPCGQHLGPSQLHDLPRTCARTWTARSTAMLDGGPCRGGRGIDDHRPDLHAAAPAAPGRTAARGAAAPCSARWQWTRPCLAADGDGGDGPSAPGMKYRHYAPKAPVTVVTGAPRASARRLHPPRIGRAGRRDLLRRSSAPLFAGRIVHRPRRRAATSSRRRSAFLTRCATFDATDRARPSGRSVPTAAGLGLAVGNRLKKAAGFHVDRGVSDAFVLGITGRDRRGQDDAAARTGKARRAACVDCDARVSRTCSGPTRRCAPTLTAAFGDVFAADGGSTGKSWATSSSATPARWRSSTPSSSRHLPPRARGGAWRTSGRRGSSRSTRSTSSRAASARSAT